MKNIPLRLTPMSDEFRASRTFSTKSTLCGGDISLIRADPPRCALSEFKQLCLSNMYSLISTAIGKPAVTVAWMIILAFWGIPALVVGFVIASLPSRYHLITLSISTGIPIVFIMNMYGSDGWAKLPSLLYLIVLPVVVAALLPIGIVRLVRSRRDS